MLLFASASFDGASAEVDCRFLRSSAEMSRDVRSERALLESFDCPFTFISLHEKSNFGILIAAKASPDLRVRDAMGLLPVSVPGKLSVITAASCSISLFPAISPTVLSAICRTSVSFSLNPANSIMLCVRFAFSLVPGVEPDLRTFPVDLMLLLESKPAADFRALPMLETDIEDFFFWAVPDVVAAAKTVASEFASEAACELTPKVNIFCPWQRGVLVCNTEVSQLIVTDTSALFSGMSMSISAVFGFVSSPAFMLSVFASLVSIDCMTSDKLSLPLATGDLFSSIFSPSCSKRMSHFTFG